MLTQHPAALGIAEGMKDEMHLEVYSTIRVNVNAQIEIINHLVECFTSNEIRPLPDNETSREKGPAFVKAVPVKEFPGAGLTAAERMKKYENEAGIDLKGKAVAFLQHFGSSRRRFYGITRGTTSRARHSR